MVVKKKQVKKKPVTLVKKKKPEVKKKEVTIGISSVPVLAPFSFEQSIEIYRYISAVPEMTVLLNSRRLNDTTTFQGCCAIGMFFIHISNGKICSEDQNKSIFYWLSKSIHPILVGYGVYSKTPSIVFCDDFQRFCYFKFLCCFGLGFLKNPYIEKDMEVRIDTETATIIKEFGCFAKK